MHLDCLQCIRSKIMTIQMYQDAILTVNLPEQGLCAGDVGTVVEHHIVPEMKEDGYSIEFFDMTGRTVAVVTVPASAVRSPSDADRPTVRVLAPSRD